MTNAPLADAPAILPDAALAHALADELLAATRLLSDLAYDLGSDPDVLRRHMESLQTVDLVTQIQLAIADVLRSTDPVAVRLSAVPLEALSARLADGYARHTAALVT